MNTKVIAVAAIVAAAIVATAQPSSGPCVGLPEIKCLRNCGCIYCYEPAEDISDAIYAGYIANAGGIEDAKGAADGCANWSHRGLCANYTTGHGGADCAGGSWLIYGLVVFTIAALVAAYLVVACLCKCARAAGGAGQGVRAALPRYRGPDYGGLDGAKMGEVAEAA